MLFNSHEFLVFFLPLALALFALAGRLGGRRAALTLLALSSLVFYAWWDVGSSFVILVSIAVNYGLSHVIGTETDPLRRRTVLTAGIAANLLFLGYFKYTGFALRIWGDLTGNYSSLSIVLPLAISFFTFQQIAFLVDIHIRHTGRPSFLKYATAVLFFPHLIAGPIVEYKTIFRQLDGPRVGRLNTVALASGATLVIIGLFKKVCVADQLAPFADRVFMAAQTQPISLLDAWIGALAFAFQIYFDFSGYSDMALGLARMFGIRLPINFNSPYKAVSIADFWRRWHITLSHFLRDHLYIPLGGNRRGLRRAYVNLMVTMVLGGLWHGANWTFVLWGTLHGGMLAIHKAWSAAGVPRLPCWAGRSLTFAVVVAAWVPFRAADLPTTWNLWRGLVGANGVVLLPSWIDGWSRLTPLFTLVGATPGPLLSGGDLVRAVAALTGALAIVWLLPNSVEWWRGGVPALTAGHRLRPVPVALAWRPSLIWTALSTGALGYALVRLVQPSQFIYFQF